MQKEEAAREGSVRVSSPKQGLSDQLPFAPAAPGGKIPGLPPWHLPRA